MQIVFFGTPLFAVATLQRLLRSRHAVRAVVTQPDRPKGRDLAIAASPVKELADENKIRVFQPEKINDEQFLSELSQLRADLFIVVSYGKILPKTLLEMPRFYCLNVHASLLPKYRGASPIAAALLNREREAGVTLIKITERLDGGDMLLQEAIPIHPQDDALTLSEKLSNLGGELLMRALERIEEGKAVFCPQQEDHATYAKRLKKEDGRIDWSQPAEQIEALVRALVPWPSACTFYQGKRLQIWKAAVEARPCYGRYGQVLKINASGEIEVSTGEQILRLLEVQPENRRRMKAGDFSRGYRLRPGDVLE
ncbi:MAG: methionyl-tRNA formyltransferase [Candidatus Omnitrophica bacterium]|nr:methionyl-tRNA formyltransferase [Candidatus Omnitrophota bacterium]